MVFKCNYKAEFMKSVIKQRLCWQEIAAEYPDVVFLKVDVDDCEGIAEYYEITSMPTFVFFKKTEKVSSSYLWLISPQILVSCQVAESSVIT